MRARAKLWGVLTALVMLVVLALWTRPVPTDSAFVTYDYARNVAAGQGLVFNPGDTPTEDYTSLLWVWVCSAMFAAGWDVPAVAPYVSLILGALCVFLLFDLLRLRAEREVQWMAPLLLFASSAPLVMISMTGTDASLFSLLLLGCTWSLDRMARRPSPVLVALLALAAVLSIICRFEGVVVAAAAVMLLPRLVPARTRGRRQVLAAAGVITVVAVAYHGWRVATFGTLVPDIVALQAGVNAGVFERLRPYDTVPFGLLYLVVALLAAVGFRLGERSTGERFALSVALLLGVLYLFIEDPTPGLANHAALLPLAIVPWPYAFRALAGQPNPERPQRVAHVLLMSAVLLIGIGLAADNRVTIQRFQESHRETLRPLGEWLAGWRPGLTLALDRPGALSYYANGRTLDLRDRSRLGSPQRDRALALRELAPDVVLLAADGQTKNVYDPGAEQFQPVLVQSYYLVAAVRMTWSHDRSIIVRMRKDIRPPEDARDTFPHGIGVPFFGYKPDAPE